MAQQPLAGQGLFLIEASQLHTTHHTLSDSSGRVISPTRRPLPDNTQHSQQTDIRAPGEIRTRNPNKWAAADHALDRAASGIDICTRLGLLFGVYLTTHSISQHIQRRMTTWLVNSELERIAKEVVVAQFEIISRNWGGRTVENHVVSTQDVQ